jgi:hypothetical protein
MLESGEWAERRRRGGEGGSRDMGIVRDDIRRGAGGYHGGGGVGGVAGGVVGGGSTSNSNALSKPCNATADVEQVIADLPQQLKALIGPIHCCIIRNYALRQSNLDSIGSLDASTSSNNSSSIKIIKSTLRSPIALHLEHTAWYPLAQRLQGVIIALEGIVRKTDGSIDFDQMPTLVQGRATDTIDVRGKLEQIVGELYRIILKTYTANERVCDSQALSVRSPNGIYPVLVLIIHPWQFTTTRPTNRRSLRQ